MVGVVELPYSRKGMQFEISLGCGPVAERPIVYHPGMLSEAQLGAVLLGSEEQVAGLRVNGCSVDRNVEMLCDGNIAVVRFCERDADEVFERYAQGRERGMVVNVPRGVLEVFHDGPSIRAVKFYDAEAMMR